MKKSLDLTFLNEILGFDALTICPKSKVGFLLQDNKLLTEVMKKLKTDERTFFDSLSCLTAIDNYPKQESIEVVYSLYSIPKKHKMDLYVVLDRENPRIESVSEIWQTANWHEREAFDLLGVVFDNHPDLRRILLPNDWIGHPLRKDYVPQERYHGIGVDYKTEE
ncbi:MAG: NADH-quinone oxidoreductase subunit C [Cytophagales bacterium]